MADSFAIIQRAVTGSTIDFTKAGFGTPKGALLYFSKAIANGTPVDGAILGIGFTDGSQKRYLSGVAEHNVNPANVADNAGTRLLVFPTTFGANIGDSVSNDAGYLSFNSWITDGLRVDVTDAPDVAYLVTCVLFGGDVTNVACGSGTVPNVQDTASALSIGFLPTFMFTGSRDNIQINDSRNVAFLSMMLGCCVPAAGNPHPQHAIGIQWTDNVSPTQTNARGHSVRGSGETFNQRNVEFRDFSASGCNAYLRDGQTSGGLPFIWLAVKMGNSLGAKLLQNDSPVGTGSHTIPGVGFTPQIGFMISSALTAWDVHRTNDEADCLGFSAFMTGTAYASAMSAVDNVATADTDSITDNDCSVNLRKGGASFLVAGLPTFNSDGVAMTYSTVNVGGTARKRIVLFVQAPAAAPPPEQFTRVIIRAAP